MFWFLKATTSISVFSVNREVWRHNFLTLWNWLAYSERTRLKGPLAKNQPASANWCGHRFALMTPSYINGVAGEHDVNVLYLLSNLRSGWFDFLTCSLFFSIPAGKFPWNDERSLHRDFIYNTCGALVMTLIHSTNQDGVDWVATKAQISYSILSFWSCCSSLKFRAFLFYQHQASILQPK